MHKNICNKPMEKKAKELFMELSTVVASGKEKRGGR